ncbi:MAG: repressor LexA [Clostridia bacterium]|nr:repressor LexA [Clostridia bacterium]
MQHKKQEYILAIEAFIDDYRDTTGVIPTMPEIAAGVGLSTGTICKYIAHMRKQGIIEYDGGQRTITTKKGLADKSAFTYVPKLGRISCGIPKFAEENIEEYVKLPVSLFGRGDFFILEAYGDSMINAGIDEGDLVLVRQQSIADYNQIVAALIDDEATLKRYRPQLDGTIRLHPENERLEDIIVEASQCVIQGVVVKILKDVR